MAEYARAYGVPSGWDIAGSFFSSAALTIIGSGPTPTYSTKPAIAKSNPFKGTHHSLMGSRGSTGSSVTQFSRGRDSVSSAGSGTSWKGHGPRAPWYTTNGHIRLTAQRLMTRISSNLQRATNRIASLFNKGSSGYERIVEDHGNVFQRDVHPGIRAWLAGVRPTEEESIPLTNTRTLNVRTYGFDQATTSFYTEFAVEHNTTGLSETVGVCFRGPTTEGHVEDTVIDFDSSSDDSWLFHADTSQARSSGSVSEVSSVDVFNRAELENALSKYDFYHPTLFRKITPSASESKSLFYRRPRFSGIHLDTSFAHYQVYTEIRHQTDSTLDYLKSIFPELQQLNNVQLADLFMRAWHSGGVVRGPGDTVDAFHFPGHNYLGPGSDINSGDVITDKDDLVAFIHDIEYSLLTTKEEIYKADERAIARFYKYLKENHGWHHAIGFLGLWIKNKFETAFARLLYPTAADLANVNPDSTLDQTPKQPNNQKSPRNFSAAVIMSTTTRKDYYAIDTAFLQSKSFSVMDLYSTPDSAFYICEKPKGHYMGGADILGFLGQLNDQYKSFCACGPAYPFAPHDSKAVHNCFCCDSSYWGILTRCINLLLSPVRRFTIGCTTMTPITKDCSTLILKCANKIGTQRLCVILTCPLKRTLNVNDCLLK